MTQVTYTLPSRQKTFVEREAERLGIAVDQLMRRIIDMYSGRILPTRPDATGARR